MVIYDENAAGEFKQRGLRKIIIKQFGKRRVGKMIAIFWSRIVLDKLTDVVRGRV